MTEFQVTYWRDLPSMVAARAGAEQSKVQLAARFGEAIDEAAMRLGDTDAEDYLAGWTRGPWTPTGEDPAAALDRVAAELDQEWPQQRIDGYLDELGPDPAADPAADPVAGPASDRDPGPEPGREESRGTRRERVE